MVLVVARRSLRLLLQAPLGHHSRAGGAEHLEEPEKEERRALVLKPPGPKSLQYHARTEGRRRVEYTELVREREKRVCGRPEARGRDE